MDLCELLRVEHSKSHSVRIAEIIGDDRSSFEDLITILTGEDKLLSQRAAWVVTCCAESQPEMVKPFLGELLQNLNRPGLHDAVKRNTMKIVAELELPDEFSGLAADTAFRLLSDPEESLAARVHSMSVLERLCASEPDLAGELRLTIEHLLPHETKPGFLSKARRVLKSLSR